MISQQSVQGNISAEYSISIQIMEGIHHCRAQIFQMFPLNVYLKPNAQLPKYRHMNSPSLSTFYLLDVIEPKCSYRPQKRNSQ